MILRTLAVNYFQTVTVWPGFLAYQSESIPFNFAIFSTNICIRKTDIKWLTIGNFGNYIMKWYFFRMTFTDVVLFRILFKSCIHSLLAVSDNYNVSLS